MPILTLQDALEAEKNKSLFLGNGFNIMYDERYRYESLIDRSSLSQELKDIFNNFEYKNFEYYMKILEWISPIFSGKLEYSICDIKINEIKDAFIKSVSITQPNGLQISDEEYRSVLEFISNYNNIFTLNYDLIIYYLILEYNRRNGLKFFDCFLPEKDGYYYFNHDDRCNVFFLHGSLFHFSREASGYKRTYKLISREDMGITRQAKEKMSGGEYPIFISEGNPNIKLSKIENNDYLKRCYDSLKCNKLPMYIFGSSLDDSHLVKAIIEGETPKLYYSLHYNDDRRNQDKIEKINSIIGDRKDIEYFSISRKDVFGSE